MDQNALKKQVAEAALRYVPEAKWSARAGLTANFFIDAGGMGPIAGAGQLEATPSACAPASGAGLMTWNAGVRDTPARSTAPQMIKAAARRPGKNRRGGGPGLHLHRRRLQKVKRLGAFRCRWK